MELNPYLSLWMKFNSRWTKYLNMRPNILERLDEKVGTINQLIGTGENFLMDSISAGNKTNIWQTESHENKKFLFNKGKCLKSDKEVFKMEEEILPAIYITENQCLEYRKPIIKKNFKMCYNS